MVAAVEEHLATGDVVAVRAWSKTPTVPSAQASHVLTRARGAEGLAEDSVIYRWKVSRASFAAFAARGLTFHLTR